MELLNDVLSDSGNEWQSLFLGQSIRWDLPLGGHTERAGIAFCSPGVFGLEQTRESSLKQGHSLLICSFVEIY